LAPVSVEAYLLDYEGDLYERRLRLEILDRLRDEQRFDTIDALVQQIHADVARVRALLSG
jgi:riboflavin kinase/FMN adenylyltransferase